MSKICFKNAKIKAMKTIIPQNKINIDDEIEFFGNSEKKLARTKKIIGYGTRYIVDENTTALDLSYEAALSLIKTYDIDRNSIDCILFLSQSRDYIMPTSANILHGLLDLNENCAAMDLSQGCSGFLYGLWNAFSLIESGAAKRILYLTADTISKYSYRNNRLINPIFGDSATATLIDYSAEKKESYFILGSRGKGWDKIVIPAGGCRILPDNNTINNDIKDSLGNEYNLHHMLMDGIDVFNFTIDVVPCIINDCMKFANLDKDEINMFALHQANKQIIEAIADKADIPLEKTPTNTFSQYGNNACNSIGVHLTNNTDLAKNRNILICGFGVGLSWACAILDFSETTFLGISSYVDTKNTRPRNSLINEFKNKFINK